MKLSLLLSAVYRQRYLLAIALGLLCAWPLVALSHAHPEQMSPAPSAVLQQAPERVVIHFSENLEAPFSSITVINEDGDSVNQGHSKVDGGRPNVMVAPLTSLGPGTYTVKWHAVAVDGHTTEGKYSFRVK